MLWFKKSSRDSASESDMLEKNVNNKNGLGGDKNEQINHWLRMTLIYNIPLSLRKQSTYLKACLSLPSKVTGIASDHNKLARWTLKFQNTGSVNLTDLKELGDESTDRRIYSKIYQESHSNEL